MERCPLNSLKPDGHHSTIIGVVIGCRKPRAQPEKYGKVAKTNLVEKAAFCFGNSFDGICTNSTNQQALCIQLQR